MDLQSNRSHTTTVQTAKSFDEPDYLYKPQKHPPQRVTIEIWFFSSQDRFFDKFGLLQLVIESQTRSTPTTTVQTAASFDEPDFLCQPQKHPPQEVTRSFLCPTCSLDLFLNEFGLLQLHLMELQMSGTSTPSVQIAASSNEPDYFCQPQKHPQQKVII